ncbi:MAG: peptidoglycan-associated lipoprotein Pal [bacterium]|nr:peptidoglycan-associated lipoprotein Pal [bacterium]
MGKNLNFLIIIIVIFVVSCQVPQKKQERVKESSLKEKIKELIEKQEPEERITYPTPEIPQIISTISEKKSKEKEEYPVEETYAENLYPIPQNIKFVSPAEINQELTDIFQNIYFDYDSYEIKRSYQEILKKIAEYLLKNPKIMILIEGHCDERGTREYNLVLGEQRASSVRNFLINLGVSPKRLFTVSYGEDKPAYLGHDEMAWVKNRRCEFKIGREK